jgi:transposase
MAGSCGSITDRPATPSCRDGCAGTVLSGSASNASGGYEGAVVAALRRDGFLVAVLQPAQVRAYGKFLLRRAKNDRIDAALIAACTAAVERIRAPADPRLAALAEPLRLLEQLSEDIARLKTRRESCREERIQAHWTAEIARLKRIRRAELKALAAAVEEHADLAARLELIASIDGIGLLTAIAILVRLPEIGQLSRAEVAALAGLAPYDDQSGRRDGARHIAGGRERLRHAVYSAAFAAAFHWNAPLKALYQRLVAAGKEHKVALVACARKLLIYANTVVTRGTPWQTRPAAG